MQYEERLNLSDHIAEQIRDMITSGTLPGNSRINEVHLAEQLGVSRTPLREALATLVSEGALENRPRKGNFVTPLTRTEFAELYGIRPILDVEALRLSGLPSSSDLDRLVDLNEKLNAATSTQTRIARDDEWHLLLIKNCGNSVLLDLIRQFILRTRRYEIAYLQSAENSQTAYQEHKVIMDALRAGDLNAACAGLKQNLTTGMEPVLNWLADLENQDGR